MPVDPSLTPEARFASISAAFGTNPDVTLPDELAPSKMFGTSAQLRIKNKIFAMLVKGRLVLKLPRHRVDALIASDDAARFDPGHGRLMKEWVSVSPETQVDWLLLAHEAMAFVGAQADAPSAPRR